MPSRRAVVLVVPATLAALAVAGAGDAATAGAATRPAALTVTLHVQPAVAGVPLVFHGRRSVTDANGEVRVRATRAELAHHSALLIARVRVLPVRLGPTRRARLVRWVGRTATLALLAPVRVLLADPAGRPVAARVAPAVVVRGTDGSQVTLRAGRVAWLAAVRAIKRPRVGWRPRRVSYAVQEVRSEGANVVHRAQQRFRPADQRRVTVQVLFFRARFTARDALFGGPIGHGIVLRFPDGHVERHRFGPGAEVTLGTLPRGGYQVRVDAPGFSFTRPVALSRSQVVALQVVSRKDIAVVAGALALVALALAVARRPHLRRPARAVRAARAWRWTLWGGGRG
jgi:hypothetical protein